MSIVMTHSITARFRKLQYLLQPVPHVNSKVNQRVLGVSGTNLRLIHDSNGEISTNQSPAYLDSQFRKSLKLAKNPNRRVQCQSIIISFSKDEFSTNDPLLEASQALQLGQLYVNRYFSDAETLLVCQCDGAGSKNDGDSKLHLHILVGAVNQHGKTIQTNRFTISKLRRNFDETMEHNFEHVTNRPWPNQMNKTREDHQSLYTKSSWQKHVKKVINAVKKEATDLADFVHQLSKYGITVKERKKGTHWTFYQRVQTSKGISNYSVRDFYQRKDKNSGAIISTRGLGTSYTKDAISKYIELNNTINRPTKEKKVKNNGREKESESIQQQAKDASLSLERQRRQRQHVIAQLNARLKSAEADEADAKRHQEQHRQARKHTDQARRRRIVNEARLNDSIIKGPRRPTSPDKRSHRESVEPEGPAF